MFHDVLRRERPGKPPKFVPFPKSLMWPTPLVFTSAIFITGLTRASVKVLAAMPDDCDGSCITAAVVTLLVILVIISLAAVE